MRLSLVSAALVAGLSATLALSVFAQGVPPAGGPIRTAPAPAPASSGGTNVVVIDVAHIFKNHNRFNAAMADLKRDIDQFETYVRGKGTEGNAKKEQLGQFRAGTPEYRQLETELARLQSEMQVEVGLKRKDFLEQESRVFFRVYQEIEKEVDVFAQRNRIDLVLRYNREPMKEDDRQSVLQGVNRAVVLQRGLDITDLILKELNRGTAPPPTNVQGAGGATGQLSPQKPIVPRPNTPVPR